MDSSPFARLPAELRVEIYNAALGQEYPIYVACPSGKRICPHVGESPQDLLAITETCKLARQESVSFFYGQNNFHLINMEGAARIRWDWVTATLYNDDARPFKSWLRAIGEEDAASIKSLTFDLGMLCIKPGMFGHEAALKYWWGDVQRVAQQLAIAGVSKECEIRVGITVSFSPHAREVCYRDDEEAELGNTISFALPTRNGRDALAEIDQAVSMRKRQYEAHEEHQGHERCSIASMGAFRVQELEDARQLFARAIIAQIQREDGTQL